MVGTCATAPLVFPVPLLANGVCEAGTAVTCTPIPGNSTGARTVTCTAKDAGGNVSAPVTFTVTVLQPLAVRIQSPLAGDNNAVINVVKAGSTVPNKVQLFACGVNVTTTAVGRCEARRDLHADRRGHRHRQRPTFNGKGDMNGVMVLDGSSYRYNLDTKGYSTTVNSPGFYQETITVAYKSAPTVVVGSDAIQVDTK